MTDPAPKSIRQAERLIHAVRCAHASIEAARCRLVFDLRGIKPASEVRALHRRVEDLALNGSLGQALRDLHSEVKTDLTEALDS